MRLTCLVVTGIALVSLLSIRRTPEDWTSLLNDRHLVPPGAALNGRTLLWTGLTREEVYEKLGPANDDMGINGEMWYVTGPFNKRWLWIMYEGTNKWDEVSLVITWNNWCWQKTSLIIPTNGIWKAPLNAQVYGRGKP
jgi:hypothetical protein